jgi:FtsH-binding integral membrane protein
MNNMSGVKSETAPRNNSVSRAPIYAAIACTVMYATLCVYMAATGGLIERVLVGGLGGYSFWIVFWMIGAIFIESAETHTARVIATGTIYGAIVGLVSGFVLTSWSYCSQPTDPTPQPLVFGIGLPALLFHTISFGGLWDDSNKALCLLSSATFWALFGLTLATLSRLRRLKTQRRLASD